MFDKTAHSISSHDQASFRARLLARQALRPQSTLAIDSGIVYRPGSSTSESARRAAEAVRDELRRRRAEAEATAKARAESARQAPTPIPAPTAAPALTPPKPAPMEEDELRSAIEAVAAHKAEERAIARQAEEIRRRQPVPAPAILPAADARGDKARELQLQVEAPEEHAGIATRIGDLSQLAFAGLAVLGLAGLSVMAAENALHGPEKPAGPGDTATPDIALKGGASAAALATASPAEPQAWFNYQGVADMLAERKAEMDAAALAAQEAAEQEARLRAANAIAEAEAARVAEAQQAAAAAAEEARLAEAAERQRLADIEAARVAEAEAARQAELEAQRQAAAEAEAQRAADLEAKKKAEAEAEARRLADAEAQRLAKLEAERKAAEEAARREAFEQAKAEAAEKLRLAALSAQQEAEAAAAVKAQADRTAAQKLSAQADSRKVAATPERVAFLPYNGPVPSAASYKPARPTIMPRPVEVSISEPTVRRSAPKALRADSASVRSFDVASPQTPEAFLASRVERTAKAPVATVDLDLVQEAFRTILENGADGSKQSILTPDGRTVSILLERTISREMGQSTVRTVTYTPAADAVTRIVTEQAPVTVSVMCRDVAYAFAGQERGRFAACQAPDGRWTLARATDVINVKTASLPKSAS